MQSIRYFYIFYVINLWCCFPVYPEKTCYLTPSIRMNGCCFMIKINSSCGFCQENPPGHYYCSGIHQFFNRYGEILTSGGRFPPVSEGKWCRECALFQGINLKNPINSLILFFSVILNITLHRAENYKCFFQAGFLVMFFDPEVVFVETLWSWCHVDSASGWRGWIVFIAEIVCLGNNFILAISVDLVKRNGG